MASSDIASSRRSDAVSGFEGHPRRLVLINTLPLVFFKIAAVLVRSIIGSHRRNYWVHVGKALSANCG